MKRLLLSFLSLILFGGFSLAQNPNVPQLPVDQQVAKIWTKQYMTGAEPVNNAVKANKTRYPGIGIGLTYYDLQTNGSVQKRLVSHGNGLLSAVWTMSLDEFDTTFPNRGTGYNTSDGNNWDVFPDDRLEVGRRVGWPSINVLPNGTTVVINHTSDGTITDGRLNILTKEAGSNDWTQDLIPSDVPPGLLWPRATVTDDGTIHVVAITTPVANDGAVYDGLDGHVLYYRSPDGGATWDQTDVKLPGFDSTSYSANSGDSYSITSRGSTVAVAHFDDWNDVSVYKSEDNGDTWERIIVNDFPLDDYVRDTRYTLDDIGGPDPDGPGGAVDADSAALRSIYTSDNAGSVVIDNDGKVHVFYGIMYVTDDNYGDGNSSYYPGWNGLAYWNEDTPAGERPAEITGALDIDGSGTLDIGEIALYFYSLSSTPYAFVDENNHIYLAYNAIMENYISADGQNYRHIYLMKSEDGGATWTEPFDVINPDLFDDDDQLYAFVEAMFPTITVDDRFVHMVYQQDYEPGLNVRGDMDPVFENEIIYLRFDKTTFTLVENVVRPEALGMTLSPNPTVDFTQLDFDLASENEVRYEVLSLDGKTISSHDLGHMPSGQYNQRLDLAGLQSGTYIVRLIIGKRAAALPVVKR